MQRLRNVSILSAFLFIGSPLSGQDAARQKAAGPTNEKAQKTYEQALGFLHEGRPDAALDSFKKADKEDRGQCQACQEKIVQYATMFEDWKGAEAASEEIVAGAQSADSVALAHYEYGVVLFNEGTDKHKDELFARSHDEFAKALATPKDFPAATFADGRALAHMKQDDAAKAQFERFLRIAPADDLMRKRAERYIDEPELARARMAPAFTVTTLDGQSISLDDLHGKVVLLDFWATWCAPCREALPHMRDIAKKFEGQPLVILSVSLDSDSQKWKDYVAQNGMSWLNCYDGYFTGQIARLYDVHEIPHTFTIDADGVLQDEHIGDASLEGRLKKLIAHAQEMQAPAEAK